MSPRRKDEKPWDGRFSETVHPLVQRYTSSLEFDRRLAFWDLAGSEAHVKMLASAGLLTEEEKSSILGGLAEIRREIEEGAFPYREELEDIHMNIEVRLCELIGPAGEKLHTGRSRNDQVILDVTLYCREAARSWRRLLERVISSVVARAEGFVETVYPAWTHLQAAQPMSFAHYLLALAAMLERDHSRLGDYLARHDVCPLGAGALTGSSLPLDPWFTARELGFSQPFTNSYDTVGSRDQVLELAQCGVQLMLHLSRLAEDFIYMASTPVGWVALPDALCTGSSMMPQKKNPDLLELLRGKTAGVIGHEQALATLLKGLPTSYQRDLQEDKLHLFEICDVVGDSLEVLDLLIEGFQLKEDRITASLDAGFLMATELAEYLVARGMAFREVHRLVGRIVRRCEETGRRLADLTLQEIRAVLPEVGEDVVEVLKPCHVLLRTAVGSTGKIPVREQLDYWKRWLTRVCENRGDSRGVSHEDRPDRGVR